MNLIPQRVPISEFPSHQNELLEKVSSKVLLLTRHGHGVAVLLGAEAYNRLLERLEDLQLAIDAVESRSSSQSILDFDEYLATGGG